MLVYKHTFFKDAQLSLKFIYALIAIKAIGCLAYYWVYFCYFPIGQNGDSASTLEDAKVIYNALPEHPTDFMKIILGLHSESESDPLYGTYFKQIQKWGRADVSTEFFLNDNRTPIRINALIMLFSFGSYAVHALVMLMLSFVGQFAFYKTFKRFFSGKEILLAIVVFLSPSVLFWSSGVLKEPIALGLMGVFIYTYFKLFIDVNYKLKYLLGLLLSGLGFLILKPYILILILLPLVIYTLVNRFSIKRVFLFYTAVSLSVLTLGLIVLKTVFHKDVINTIVVRENDFVSLSRGGIFFDNDQYYLRFEYGQDDQYELADSVKQLYRMKPHSNYMYWDLKNLKDTIFVNDNKDTTTLYKHLWTNTPAGSAITMRRLEYSFSSIAAFVPLAFYHVLCKPFFYDSRSIMEHMASLENLVFLVFFIWCFWKSKKEGVDKNLFWMCVFIVVSSFVLVGITTTVMGAIVRYKVPFIPFLLMIPLMYLDKGKLNRIPFIKKLTT